MRYLLNRYDWKEYLFQKRSLLIILLLLLGGCEWVLLFVDYKYYLLLCIAVTGLGIAISNYKYLWALGIACMPLSIESELISQTAITLPSDFMAIALLYIWLLKLPDNLKAYQKLLKHPLLQIILLFWGWMFLTSLTSTMPVVSLKFWLSATWYLAAFLGCSLIFFRKYSTCIRWPWYAAIPLLIVVSYTIFMHALERFSLHASYTIMQPFYKEHTAYAASIGLFVMVYGILAIKSDSPGIYRIGAGCLFFLMLLAVITSYTRGAWLGIFVGTIVGVLLSNWKRLRFFFSISLLVSLLLIPFLLNMKIIFDTDEHSKSKSMEEHLLSIINTRTDLSNKERINRWVAAYGMVQQKPLFGFGPGTFAMQYAPYQQARFKTIISTNQGDNGTAHNEFLLAASEMGIPGMLLITAVFGLSFWYSAQGVLRNSPHRYLYAIACCSLTTFYVHAMVNNFMDQDKVAIPVFVCWALIIALDTWHLQDSEPRQGAFSTESA